MKTERDISIISIDENKSLVISCDNSAGIGPRKGDYISSKGETVGLFTTRVALMEVLAVGAKPISIIDTLSMKMETGGREILDGIQRAAKEAELDFDSLINGSTEDNIQTSETAVGITIVGITENEKIKMCCTNNGDLLAAIGIPLTGQEVLDKKIMAADLFDLKKLINKSYVREIIPVGSRGIKYEADLLAKMSELRIDYCNGLNVDLRKSAGPATVLLLSLSPGDIFRLREDFSHKPVHLIGKFKNKQN